MDSISTRKKHRSVTKTCTCTLIINVIYCKKKRKKKKERGGGEAEKKKIIKKRKEISFYSLETREALMSPSRRDRSLSPLSS